MGLLRAYCQKNQTFLWREIQFSHALPPQSPIYCQSRLAPSNHLILCSSFFPPTTIHVKIDTLFYTSMKCAFYTVSFVPHYYLWTQSCIFLVDIFFDLIHLAFEIPHSKIDPWAYTNIIKLANIYHLTYLFLIEKDWLITLGCLTNLLRNKCASNSYALLIPHPKQNVMW